MNMKSLIELRKELKQLQNSYWYELRMNDNTHFPYMDEMIEEIKSVKQLLAAQYGVTA